MTKKKALKKSVKKIERVVSKALKKGVPGALVQEAVDEAAQKVANHTGKPVKKPTTGELIDDKFMPAKLRRVPSSPEIKADATKYHLLSVLSVLRPLRALATV
ncbi:MAG: hypothetical protein WBW03_31625 [Silvibacterium sp.]